jgi:hypothetical protein
MGFASLGSGSRGNGTLVALGDALFLVDCGFNLKQAEQRLARRQVSAQQFLSVMNTATTSRVLQHLLTAMGYLCTPLMGR